MQSHRVSVKLELGGDLRRVVLPASAKLSALRSTIASSFGGILGTQAAISYTDGDNDRILLTTECEWEEAKRYAASRKANAESGIVPPLRVIVGPAPPAQRRVEPSCGTGWSGPPVTSSATAPPPVAATPPAPPPQPPQPPPTGKPRRACTMLSLAVVVVAIIALAGAALRSIVSARRAPPPAQMRMSGRDRTVEVRIRGDDPARGVLEMNIDGGGWGAVCDDDFGSAAANAVCRQLGYPAGGTSYDASHGNRRGTPTYHKGSNFAVDDLSCPSDANSLDRCSTGRSPYEHNCDESETVGIQCRSAGTASRTAATQPSWWWLSSAPPACTFGVGDSVQVKPSVSSPKHGWGGVSHGDCGTVTSMSGTMKVDFPRSSSWSAAQSEMEPCGGCPVHAAAWWAPWWATATGILSGGTTTTTPTTTCLAVKASGICEQAARIKSLAACSSAAQELGLPATSAESLSDGDYPPGCYFKEGGKKLFYNTRTSSSASCTSKRSCIHYDADACATTWAGAAWRWGPGLVLGGIWRLVCLAVGSVLCLLVAAVTLVLFLLAAAMRLCVLGLLVYVGVLYYRRFHKPSAAAAATADDDDNGAPLKAAATAIATAPVASAGARASGNISTKQEHGDILLRCSRMISRARQNGYERAAAAGSYCRACAIAAWAALRARAKAASAALHERGPVAWAAVADFLLNSYRVLRERAGAARTAVEVFAFSGSGAWPTGMSGGSTVAAALAIITVLLVAVSTFGTAVSALALATVGAFSWLLVQKQKESLVRRIKADMESMPSKYHRMHQINCFQHNIESLLRDHLRIVGSVDQIGFLPEFPPVPAHLFLMLHAQEYIHNMADFSRAALVSKLQRELANMVATGAREVDAAWFCELEHFVRERVCQQQQQPTALQPTALQHAPMDFSETDEEVSSLQERLRQLQTSRRWGQCASPRDPQDCPIKRIRAQLARERG